MEPFTIEDCRHIPPRSSSCVIATPLYRAIEPSIGKVAIGYSSISMLCTLLFAFALVLVSALASSKTHAPAYLVELLSG